MPTPYRSNRGAGYGVLKRWLLGIWICDCVEKRPVPQANRALNTLDSSRIHNVPICRSFVSHRTSESPLFLDRCYAAHHTIQPKQNATWSTHRVHQIPSSTEKPLHLFSGGVLRAYRSETNNRRAKITSGMESMRQQCHWP